MNQTQAGQLVGVLAAGYPQWQVTKETVAVWADLLLDVNYDEARLAIREWLLTEERPPSPAAVRRAIAGNRGLTAPSRATAWAEVRKGLTTSSNGSKPPFSHPAVSRAVETIGWWEIKTSTNLDTLRSQFWKVYEELAKESDKQALIAQNLSIESRERTQIGGV